MSMGYEPSSAAGHVDRVISCGAFYRGFRVYMEPYGMEGEIKWMYLGNDGMVQTIPEKYKRIVWP